ncbi:MAG: hypothetical protein GTO02_18710 [Candidatus Dadabacteria bacterium]|nr:hypothetical protein [Candidatus Dadabacteria bacterium]NIQ16342.1 hypothetical protein [Candidatus Dadabacteria bacterium]
MQFYKNLFWGTIVILLLVATFKIVPIYYRANELRNICKENADLYHRYNKKYIISSMEHEIEKLNIPRENIEYQLTKTKEAIFIELYYEDTANFFDKYEKDFEFYYKCEGVLESIL